MSCDAAPAAKPLVDYSKVCGIYNPATLAALQSCEQRGDFKTAMKVVDQVMAERAALLDFATHDARYSFMSGLRPNQKGA